MHFNNLVKTLALFFISLFLFTPVSIAGFNRPNTDIPDGTLFYFFDLRERESFIQLTNINTDNAIVHIQVFNVADNCNENNFFDIYTPNDSHTYNMREILTNDGNPSGVVLPDGAYGIVAALEVISVGGFTELQRSVLIGNLRIIDNNGYEYRTNAQGVRNTNDTSLDHITFNFDTSSGIQFSDIVGIPFSVNNEEGEVLLTDITNNFYAADIDIYNENEVVFSCRNVIFACTDQDNPLLEELLEEAGVASVASFEYGINETIPHSKGGELLCPNNIVGQGFVFIDVLENSDGLFTFIGFAGLNNGNERGTIDSFWYRSEAPSPW